MNMVDEIFEEFDGGMYNAIAVGYAMIAMRDAGIEASKSKEVENIMRKNYDFIDAEEAYKYYQSH